MYELTAEYLEVLELAQDAEIEQQVIIDTLESISGSIEDKADNYAKIIKSLSGQAEIIKAEEVRLTSRRTSLEKTIKRMKESLENAMLITGKKKFKTDLFSFSIQKNAPSLKIKDGAEIPECYLIEQEPKIDTALIKESLKNGASLDFAELVSTESIRIR